MKRNIKRNIKKAAVGIMAASMLTVMAAPLAVVPVSATTVTRGSYDFSNMVVRRVWFNTDDPVFLIDNYQRVWLDNSVNVVATGDSTDVATTSNLMAPMKNMFAQLGATYMEDGDTVIISMNDTTVKLKIGSADVEINGKTNSGALTSEQIPVKVNAKETYAEYNTFLTEDYNVVYLPVAYVLDIFGAHMYKDLKINCFYASVPVMKTETVPSYETSSDGYGARYDALLEGNVEISQSVADAIVALQNSDGGFGVLPDNFEMSQENAADVLGSLKSVSSIENGTTTAQLKYLAKFITNNKPEDSKYQDAFVKGVEFLLSTQLDNGGWTMQADGKGFNGNIEVGNKGMTEVLTLLSDIAVLNNQNYVFARKTMDVDKIKAAVNKGNDFLIASQISNNDKKAGWASQYDKSGKVTMGRTYERESVSSYTTKDVIDYLMTIHNPSEAVCTAIESAYAWLKDVKIDGKEQEVVEDTSMNNGFDVYLVDGNGTWASNYVYEADSDSYRPLYSDVDPTRADQKYVNIFEVNTLEGNNKTTVNNKDLILYSTRTSISYYDNNLADELIATGYDTWKGYVQNGFPEVPSDPDDNKGNDNNNSGDNNGNNSDVKDEQNNQNGQSGQDSQTPQGNSQVSDSNTKTGDKAPIALYAAILAASAGLAGVCAYGYKKGKISKNTDEK